ncbi:hypothetical protein [Kitasatospora sp. A2-31]|uniref:hypothetical protein n=1 Tax=Kitasatospora sp. A2-31 TaxID=2916414 RepID=UPI001EEC7963|nr:hypothetical protein [Kitasatospora sp. A2-31]MCG6497000.1 hypothetical protein [Kitasatospora sp. A2-31]
MHIAGGNFHARLPHHLSEQEQNRAASSAASLLQASGFEVELDPALGTPPPTAAFVPIAVPDPAAALADLTHRLTTGDNGYDGTAHLAQAVLGHNGVLARLVTFTKAAAAWSARLGHAPGDDLSDLLTESADTLGEVQQRLGGTATRITTMGTSWEPHRSSPRQAAATAGTHSTSTGTTPAPQTPPQAPSAEPHPGRRR